MAALRKGLELVLVAVSVLLLVSIAFNVIQYSKPAPSGQNTLILTCPTPSGTACPAATPEITLRVPNPPVAATLDGKLTLVYELQVSNYTPLTLEHIDVFDNSTGTLIMRLGGNDLNNSLKHDFRSLGNVVFMWVEPANDVLAIHHKLFFSDGSVVEGGDAPVTHRAPITIAFPLAGGNWLAANGPSNYVGHRQTTFTLNGKAYISQRYAIDWLQYGPNGKLFRTDGKTVQDYYGYGADVLAVADGTAIDVKDYLPDNIPGQLPTVSAYNAGGNYVVLEIANSTYAFYAHMIPGSIRVKIGDTVRKGDTIGRLGSAGNSDAPHLHFHIMGGRDALFAEGMPYTFESYQLVGIARNWGMLWGTNGTWSGWLSSPVVKRNTMPIDGDVVNFTG